MNYYFFPEIEGFDSSVTLVNFPSLDNQKSMKGDQYIYATWSDGVMWHYRVLGEIKHKEAVEIKYSEISKNIPTNSFVFFHYGVLPEFSCELILSDHMYVMPTWRGNIKIFSDDASTSYEGDYQHEMVAYIKKGSLVSLSPMLQSDPSIDNVFIFVNITKCPSINKHKIYFFDPLKKEIIHESYVFNNKCNIIDLSSVSIPQETPVLVISKTIAGIPIYFSYTKDKKHLSFEHTHPPASLVVFGAPLYFQKKFKNYWLQELEKIR